MGFWQKLCERLPVEFCWNTEVISVRRNSDGIILNVKDENEIVQVMEFDQIIISGAFPFKSGKIYRSPSTNLPGLLN